MVNVKPFFPTLEEAFRHHMPGQPPTDGCWPWSLGSDGNGYGQIFYGSRVKRTKIRAHVASYRLHHGDIPDGHVVRHRCHNPRCVHPDHLVTGTRAQNSQDMVLAGRSMIGERAPHAKLTEPAVRAIRSAASNGASRQGLADQYGVSRSAVAHVLNRATWRHI